MENKICRIGIFGTFRGLAYLKIFASMDDVKITAICDKRPEAIANALPHCPDDVKTFASFDEFIDSGLFDAVLLTNYFHEHAPFAVKAMQRGIHVLSETTPASTLAECVALVRAVEETGCKYMLAENYPFMCANLELKRVYETGTLGKALFAEGEYVHPMDPREATDKYAPFAEHWRRHTPCTYYSTHALAPLMHITGAIPTKVNARAAFDSAYALERQRYVADRCGIILCETDQDSIFRISGSCSFGPHGNWYRIGCDRGGIETVRGNQSDVRLCYNSWQLPEGAEPSKIYTAQWTSNAELASKAGHGGGDFWVCYNFVRYVLDDVEPFFTVYRAAAMSAVAIQAWKSVLDDGATYRIPDFRKEADRKEFENDHLTPFPDAEGGATLPRSSKPFDPEY